MFIFSEILCCVFTFYWLSDEGIKHWFNLYFNEWKLNINILANKGDLLFKIKYFVIMPLKKLMFIIFQQ